MKLLTLLFSFFSPPGFIMTVSRPCYFGNLLLGVVGVDVNLAYILEDVTYYQDSLASYTFLIDNKGWSLGDEGGRPLVINARARSDTCQRAENCAFPYR